MSTGAKMRVYEIAREVGLPNKELISKIRALGLEVNNHMSSLDGEDVARVKRSLEKERLENTVTKRLSKTVLRRRSKARKKSAEPQAAQEASPAAAAPEAESSAPAPSEKPAVRARRAPASAGDGAAATAKRRSTKTAAAAASASAPKKRPAVAEAKAEPAAGDGADGARTKPEPVTAEPAAKAPPSEPKVAEPKPKPEPAPEPPKVSKAAPKKATVAKAEKEREPAPASDRADRQEAEVAQAETAAKAPSKPASEPAEPARARNEEKVKEEAAEADSVPTGPKTVAEVADDARARFEAELERARHQAVEREKERERRAKEKQAEVDRQAREEGRPEPGTIINLPMTRIKITERGPSSRQMPGQGQVRGRFAQQQQRGRRGRDVRKKQRQKGGKQTQITTPAEHKRVIRMEDTIAVPDLAKGMGIKATEVLRKLWGMGMTGVMINASIDHETAQIVANEFGYEVQNVAFKEETVFERVEDEAEDLKPRAPVVTIMGHVDHGKTSLLDYIRKTRVAAGEAGGITQHIGAYRVDAGEDYGDIVFIDTPGHAAFTEMRARGAQSTDICVLVCAADDGVMPQTLEALQHAKEAKVGLLVAVNKIDVPKAQPERVRQQLADHGLIPEEWGGDTLYVDVSAATGEGIDKLLESISLTAELLELKANPAKPAVGVVIESKLDRARGSMATVLIQEGTVHVGDIVVVGEHMGKVRAMLDHTGQNVKEAGPSTPVEVLGIDGVPEAGETLNATADEKMAKQVVEHRRQQKRKKELASAGKVSLENLMERIQEGAAKELKVVLKADVHGTAEALKEALTKLSTDKVQVNVISHGVGGITESDVNLAKAGGAIVVGFHVRPAGKSSKLAEQEGVEINLYDVIYECLDEIKSAMAGLLAPVRREREVGKLEVRDTFNIPRRGVVAGCYVTEGRVERKSLVRVIRDSVQIYEGKISSLRRFKDDTSEVKEGYECGLMVEGFNDIRVGDIVESYEIVEEKATL